MSHLDSVMSLRRTPTTRPPLGSSTHEVKKGTSSLTFWEISNRINGRSGLKVVQKFSFGLHPKPPEINGKNLPLIFIGSGPGRILQPPFPPSFSGWFIKTDLLPQQKRCVWTINWRTVNLPRGMGKLLSGGADLFLFLSGSGLYTMGSNFSEGRLDLCWPTTLFAVGKALLLQQHPTFPRWKQGDAALNFQYMGK